MKFPSKVTPYKESILAKLPVVLTLLQQEDMSPPDLYMKVKSKVKGVAELVEILDCLYALGQVEIINDGRVLHYVENGSM